MNKWLRGLAAVGFVVGMTATVAAQDSALDTSKAVEIKVDLAKKVGKYEPIYRWFGYDESNYSTTPNGRKLLGELHEMSPVPVSGPWRLRVVGSWMVKKTRRSWP